MVDRDPCDSGEANSPKDWASLLCHNRGHKAVSCIRCLHGPRVSRSAKVFQRRRLRQKGGLPLCGQLAKTELPSVHVKMAAAGSTANGCHMKVSRHPVVWESLFMEGADHQFSVREESPRGCRSSFATYETPESQLCRLEDMNEVRELLRTLPSRDREVMTRRYGFQGPPESLAEIGQSHGVSKQRVSQWEIAAREELRTKLKGR